MIELILLDLPLIPRSISGLKTDGTKDKRYKAGNTMVELQEYMELACGTHRFN